jgi:16S rRNA (guanine966-N2)-methyltransferase
MRVVAGELRGRKFDAPPGTDTRPTTDKVREAVFNALGSLDVVRDAVVVDLFAGSGGMGIEALSRGAAEVVFVERDRNASRVLHANLRALDLTSRSRVQHGDALAVARGLRADLVIADPPYDFDQWPDLLEAVDAPVLVAEAGRPLDELDGRAGWSVTRSRRYGRTWISFFERTVEAGAEPGPDAGIDRRDESSQ